MSTPAADHGPPTAGPPARAPRRLRPGCGLAVAVLLLLTVEAVLHTDAFLLRYRSVFAAGRAMDKLRYAESRCPALLVLGNSRADNAFDPRTLRQELGSALEGQAFNLGLPGADIRVLAGVVERLDAVGCLRPGGVRDVVLTLDEALLQHIDTLGQDVFFGNRSQMWAQGQYLDLLRASLRLYGFAPNLRQLREPATLQRFARASMHDVDPLGGAAAVHLGYRAGFGGLQDQQSALKQEAGSAAPPVAANLIHLWRLLDRLAAQGVRVVVVYPPLLNREMLYQSAAGGTAEAYRAVDAELQRRRIPVIAFEGALPRDPAEFVNAGHLNDRGAQRYSRALAQSLARVWRGDAAPATERGDRGAPERTPAS